MASKTQYLVSQKLIQPPKWLVDNICYEVITGSKAYGVSEDSSDMDIYGWCIPLKEDVFPNLKGLVPGFDDIQNFEQFQQHHIHSPDDLAGKGREYDISIYSIIKYFRLCMENNPNMIDTLFVPLDCVLHSTQVGNLVRENRRLFLHKGSYHKFLGYAHSQLHKMASMNREGKRKESFEKHGYDVKYAYHLVRLSYEAEMILLEEDLDLRKNREHLKSIRRGDIKEQDIRDWFTSKEKYLEKVYQESKLRHKPEVSKIRDLLLSCLEQQYGSLAKVYVKPNQEREILRSIKDILDKANI